MVRAFGEFLDAYEQGRAGSIEVLPRKYHGTSVNKLNFSYKLLLAGRGSGSAAAACSFAAPVCLLIAGDAFAGLGLTGKTTSREAAVIAATIGIVSFKRLTLPKA
jgi:hypothetical protein